MRPLDKRGDVFQVRPYGLATGLTGEGTHHLGGQGIDNALLGRFLLGGAVAKCDVELEFGDKVFRQEKCLVVFHYTRDVFEKIIIGYFHGMARKILCLLML